MNVHLYPTPPGEGLATVIRIKDSPFFTEAGNESIEIRFAVWEDDFVGGPPKRITVAELYQPFLYGLFIDTIPFQVPFH